MEVYSLTRLGRTIAHSPRGGDSPEWSVVYFLAKQGKATTEQIKSYVPTASSSTLAKLRTRGIIRNEAGVSV